MPAGNHRKYYDGLDKLQDEQQVSTRVANDVLYLRTQKEWTQEREDTFIAQAKTGEIPDITQVGKE